MTSALDEPASSISISYPASKLPHDLAMVLRNEFPELSRCDRVDYRLLWTENKKSRYRINGWHIRKGLINNSVIIFSLFIIAWDSEKGIQYEVPSKNSDNRC